MKIIRENIFETNSSSTHSLTYKKIGNKLPPRAHKKNWQGKELPIEMDTPNIKVEVREFHDGVKYDDLTNIEYNASYLFTKMQLLLNSALYERKATEAARINEALGQFHIMLLENELIPKYGDLCVNYQVYDYNLDGHWEDSPRVTPSWSLKEIYMEQNDGGFIEDIDDVFKIIDTKEHLRDFLTKGKIKIKYEG